jgi:small subunit ribosomal protein S7
MSRRSVVPKREILPDPLYNSQLVTKFVSVLLEDGKKSVAERILYDALAVIRERTEEDPVKVLLHLSGAGRGASEPQAGAVTPMDPG